MQGQGPPLNVALPVEWEGTGKSPEVVFPSEGRTWWRIAEHVQMWRDYCPGDNRRNLIPGIPRLYQQRHCS